MLIITVLVMMLTVIMVMLIMTEVMVMTNSLVQSLDPLPEPGALGSTISRYHHYHYHHDYSSDFLHLS